MKNIFLALLTLLVMSQAHATAFDVCYQAAERVLEWDDAARVQNCENLGAGFVSCWNVAQDVIDWSDAAQIQACRMAGAGFHDCYQNVKNSLDLDLGAKVQLCIHND